MICFLRSVCFGLFIFSPAMLFAGVDIVYENNKNYSLANPEIIFQADGYTGSEVHNAANSLFPNLSRSDNTVTVKNSTLRGSSSGGGVYGGIGANYNGYTTPASNNKVYIINSSVRDVHGGLGVDVGANGNRVEITGTSIIRNAVYGGRIESGTNLTANDNYVYIGSGSTVNGSYGGNVYGAYVASSGGMNNNHLVIDGATLKGEIIAGAFGGPTGAKTATNNTVTINSGSIIEDANIYGGRGLKSANSSTIITNNKVIINGGEINLNSSVQRGIYGGQNLLTNNGSLEFNEVEINGGTIKANIYGGEIHDGTGGQATENKVTISGVSTKVIGDVYGGYTTEDTTNSIVEKNKVSISNAQVIGNISGGYVNKGSIIGNEVNISSGKIDGNIYGGYAINDDSSSQIANNIVQMSNVNINEGIDKKSIYGGYSSNGNDTNVISNEVAISGGTINADIYGGYAKDGTNSIEKNKVTISGSNTKGDVYGGYTNDGLVTGNEVNISNSKIDGNIYGGYSVDELSDLVQENNVNLSNATVTGTVYNANYSSYEKGDRLTVSGGLTNVGSVYGFQYTDIKSGTTLNILDSTYPSNFYSLTNNGFLTFYNNALNQGIVYIGESSNTSGYYGSGKIGLEVFLNENATENDADSIVFTGATHAPVILTFKVLPGSVPSPNVQKVRIATDLYDNNIDFRTTDPGYGIYAYNIEKIGDDHFLSLTNKYVKDIGKNYTKVQNARLAQLAFTVLRNGLESAISTVDEQGFGISVDIGYSTQNFDTSGSTELEGTSGLITLAYNKMGSPLAFGMFAETFDGTYETSSGVEVQTGKFNLRSGGNMKSYGGGLSVSYRENLAQAIQSGNFVQFSQGLHLEAIIRAGRSEVGYEDYNREQKSSFDMSGMYYGGTLGAGYVFTNDEGFAVDLYSRAVWISMEEDEVVDSLGQEINYDKADSLRTIYGFSVGYMPNEYARYYIGAALDWEQMGEAGATIDGYKIEGEDMSGESALFEIGANWKAKKNVFIDLKAAGSTGMRDGYGGLIEFKYIF